MLPFQGPENPNNQSLRLSSRWAIDSHRGVMGRLTSPMRVRTGAQLAGTHFPAGQVYNPTNRMYQDLLNARTISAGGTLNAYHVTLESQVGQYLKSSMGLPFQEHSRVDSEAAARQAQGIYQVMMDPHRTTLERSVVRGPEGPRLVYHGTPFTYRGNMRLSRGPTQLFGPGRYFTESLQVATSYSQKSVGSINLTPDVIHVIYDFPKGRRFTAQQVAERYQRRWGKLRDIQFKVSQVRQPSLSSSTSLNPNIGTQVEVYKSGRPYPGRRILQKFLDVRHPFDIDAPLDIALAERLGVRIVHEGTTNEALYHSLVSSYGPEGTYRHLRRVGYDAITHIGGGRVGGDYAHRVWIPFSLSQIVDPSERLPASRQLSLFPEIEMSERGIQGNFEILRRSGLHWSPERPPRRVPGQPAFNFSDPPSQFIPIGKIGVIRPGIPSFQFIPTKDIHIPTPSTITLPVPLGAKAAEASTPAALKEGIQQLHVNLESKVGQWLKRIFQLPFKLHSRVDPLKAATFAEEMLGEAGAKGGAAMALPMPQGMLRPAAPESLIEQQMRKLGPALAAFQGQIDKPIGAGVESLAVQMKSGDILKLSTEALEEGMGARAFDVPVLRRGTITGLGDPIHYMVQPKVEMARTPTESQKFFGELGKAGYQALDPGERQFGYYKGKAVLVDYSAVLAPGGTAEFASRTPARNIPTPENFKITSQGLVREQIVPGSTVPSFRRPVAETAAQATHYQSLTQSLSREAIEGGAIGTSVRSTMEAAEKIAAKETLHELHVNLESGVGKWLKAAFKLPFKGRSRVDALKAAGAVIEAEAKESNGKFVGRSFVVAGLVAAGAFTLRSAVRSVRQEASHHVSPISAHEGIRDRDEHEKREGQTNVRHKRKKPMRIQTNVDIRDHDLDMRQVDEAFTNHLKTGFAYSHAYN